MLSTLMDIGNLTLIPAGLYDKNSLRLSTLTHDGLRFANEEHRVVYAGMNATRRRKWNFSDDATPRTSSFLTDMSSDEDFGYSDHSGRWKRRMLSGSKDFDQHSLTSRLLDYRRVALDEFAHFYDDPPFSIARRVRRRQYWSSPVSCWMNSDPQPVYCCSNSPNSWDDYHLRQPDAFLSSDPQLLVHLPTALGSAAIKHSLPSFLVSWLLTKMDYGSNDSKPRKLIAACLSYPFFLVHILVAMLHNIAITSSS
ncbi:hypothetical protein DL96DRAFT_1710735 [Flagelloscypha sp. PMI_526]|nr:hypothetical protein DL96DRAFT_1710735 [Flagelloscypha sp. PMI_526]